MDQQQKPQSASGDLRFYFAAQRTMLAWIRTAVALMGFGFIVARFGLFLSELAAMRGLPATGQGRMPVFAGTALLMVGVAVSAVAAVRFATFARGFRRGATPGPTGIGVELGVATLVALIGIVLAVYLVVVD